MNIKALLKQVPATAYIVSWAIVILWGAWMANSYHQREIGKRDLLIATHERRRSAFVRSCVAIRKSRLPISRWW